MLTSAARAGPGPAAAAAVIAMYRALYGFRSAEPNSLPFAAGETFLLLERSNQHWWLVTRAGSGETGYAPASYLQRIQVGGKGHAGAGLRSARKGHAGAGSTWGWQGLVLGWLGLCGGRGLMGWWGLVLGWAEVRGHGGVELRAGLGQVRGHGLGRGLTLDFGGQGSGSSSLRGGHALAPCPWGRAGLRGRRRRGEVVDVVVGPSRLLPVCGRLVGVAPSLWWTLNPCAGAVAPWMAGVSPAHDSSICIVGGKQGSLGDKH